MILNRVVYPLLISLTFLNVLSGRTQTGDSLRVMASGSSFTSYTEDILAGRSRIDFSPLSYMGNRSQRAFAAHLTYRYWSKQNWSLQTSLDYYHSDFMELIPYTWDNRDKPMGQLAITFEYPWQQKYLVKNKNTQVKIVHNQMRVYYDDTKYVAQLEDVKSIVNRRTDLALGLITQRYLFYSNNIEVKSTNTPLQGPKYTQSHALYLGINKEFVRIFKGEYKNILDNKAQKDDFKYKSTRLNAGLVLPISYRVLDNAGSYKRSELTLPSRALQSARPGLHASIDLFRQVEFDYPSFLGRQYLEELKVGFTYFPYVSDPTLVPWQLSILVKTGFLHGNFRRAPAKRIFKRRDY